LLRCFAAPFRKTFEGPLEDPFWKADVSSVRNGTTTYGHLQEAQCTNGASAIGLM